MQTFPWAFRKGFNDNVVALTQKYYSAVQQGNVCMAASSVVNYMITAILTILIQLDHHEQVYW